MSIAGQVFKTTGFIADSMVSRKCFWLLWFRSMFRTMKRSKNLVSLAFLACLSSGCSASLGLAEVDEGGEGGTVVTGSVPRPPENNGLVFVSHFFEDSISGRNLLQWYGVGESFPEFGGEIDVETTSHSMALDNENELLALVSDAGRTVKIYDVSEVTRRQEPEVLSVLSFREEIPLFADFDSDSNRLYVSASPISSSIATNNSLYVYDTSDPRSPQLVSGAPFTIPVTASWGLDPFRNVLWLVDFRAKELIGYDLLENGIEEIPGAPLRLTDLYPEDNQFVFQARDLTVDPWRSRIYAARSQGELSELIAIDYPSQVPGTGQKYGDVANMSSLKRIEDAIDVTIPMDNRATLLDAYEVAFNS